MSDVESFESLEHRVMGGIMATARVSASARMFWSTTDEDPLCGMTATQAMLWDELCNALSREEEWR